MSDPNWFVRKHGGKWRVLRDGYLVAEFRSFDALLNWQPDCARFLAGYCKCRDGCAL